MEFIIDYLVEAFFEWFGEGFVSLGSAFFPNKALPGKAQHIIGAVFLIIALALFVGLIVGIALLIKTRGQSFWGWLLIALSVIYVISGVILNIIS